MGGSGASKCWYCGVVGNSYYEYVVLFNTDSQTCLMLRTKLSVTWYFKHHSKWTKFHNDAHVDDDIEGDPFDDVRQFVMNCCQSCCQKDSHGSSWILRGWRFMQALVEEALLISGLPRFEPLLIHDLVPLRLRDVRLPEWSIDLRPCAGAAATIVSSRRHSVDVILQERGAIIVSNQPYSRRRKRGICLPRDAPARELNDEELRVWALQP